ncbi:MAG: YciC family protein [Buchnera aphidicola (Chaetogeoica yunlongensis)]
MHITANLLFRDTINFFKLKRSTIIIFILLSSSLTLTIDSIITPNIKFTFDLNQLNIDKYYSVLNFFKTLNLDQQKMLLLSSITRSFSLLIGNTLLLGNLIKFIQNTSCNKLTNFFASNNLSFRLFFRLMQLIFITTFITQLGFLSFVIPGMIFFIFFSLSPIILITENKTVFDSIYLSTKIIFQHFKIIIPAITFWLCLKVLIILIISHIKILSEYTELFILNLCMNFISSILIIYLFRFYMLFSKNQK